MFTTTSSSKQPLAVKSSISVQRDLFNLMQGARFEYLLCF